METLAFANGKTMNGHCLETGGKLWLYLQNVSLAEAFQTLIEPENTRTIRAARYGRETVVTGYTHLFCVSEESGGMVNAGLRKEE